MSRPESKALAAAKDAEARILTLLGDERGIHRYRHRQLMDALGDYVDAKIAAAFEVPR